jgi:hypothetical protein
VRALTLLAGVTALLGLPSSAAAQTRQIGVVAAMGTGLAIGQGDAQAITRRSPMFLDVGARTWSDEQPEFAWGGSLRLEVEGRASVAIVPRAELPRSWGPFQVRATLGAPVFFAPFTMLGLEAGGVATWSFAPRMSLYVALLFDAFVIGSDLPRGSAMLMCNGAFGVEFDPS